MRISMKKAFMFLSIFTTVAILASGCSNPKIDKNIKKSGEIPTSYTQASFVIDINNPKEVVGYADYAFVGLVEEMTGTDYKFPVTKETEDGPKVLTMPYTNYSVKVLDNIKGNLKKDVSIPIQKFGGLNDDKSEYFLFEDDSLPQKGKVYVFTATAEQDGSLLVSGPNSNIEVKTDFFSKKSIQPISEESIANELTKTEEYKTYQDAYKNEIVKDRERSTSKYEAP
ncbi:cell surface protein [Paenibacillus sp. FSL R10-2782]|uniref:cell surface protein n=1 Tax=Paenibacillus sp. FSL R10-2782 TaxID=2954661 RepID=UPI0031591180